MYEDLFTVRYWPGLHGTFMVKTVTDLLFGALTPSAPDVTGELGWRFTGWSPVLSTIVTGDADYTALWEQVTFTVRFVD